jgi:hypothetical protein
VKPAGEAVAAVQHTMAARDVTTPSVHATPHFSEDDVAAVVETVTARLQQSFREALSVQEHRYEHMLHRLYHVMQRSLRDGGDAMDFDECRRIVGDGGAAPFESPRTSRHRSQRADDTAQAPDTHAIVRLRKQFERIAMKHDRPLEKVANRLRTSDRRLKEALSDLRALESAGDRELAQGLAAENAVGTLLASHVAQPSEDPPLQKSSTSRKKSRAGVSFVADTDPAPGTPGLAADGDGEPFPSLPDGPCWSFEDLRVRLAECTDRIDRTLAAARDPAREQALCEQRRRSASGMPAEGGPASDAAIATLSGDLVHRPPRAAVYCFSVGTQADDALSPQGSIRSEPGEPELAECSLQRRDSATSLPGHDRLGMSAEGVPPEAVPARCVNHSAARPKRRTAKAASTQTANFELTPQLPSAGSQADGEVELTFRSTSAVSDVPPSPNQSAAAAGSCVGGGVPVAPLEYDVVDAAREGSQSGVSDGGAAGGAEDGDEARASSPRPNSARSSAASPLSKGTTPRARRSSRTPTAAKQTRDAIVDVALGDELLAPLLQREQRVHEMGRVFNRLFFALSTTAQSLLLYTDGYENELTCRCCFRMLENPQVIWPCGHSFCKACIEREMGTADTSTGDIVYKCLQCATVSYDGFATNVALDALTARWNFKKRTVAEPSVTMAALRDVLSEVAAGSTMGSEAAHDALNPPMV